MNPNTVMMELGRTPKNVYRSLKRIGITGIPGKSRNCPIANYFAQRHNMTCIVSPSHITFTMPDAIVVMTEAVRKFVSIFDANGYQDLIEEE